MAGKPIMERKVAIATSDGGAMCREIVVIMAMAGARVVANGLGVSVSGDGGSATPAEETDSAIC
jgi:hypothetical protein